MMSIKKTKVHELVISLEGFRRGPVTLHTSSLLKHFSNYLFSWTICFSLPVTDGSDLTSRVWKEQLDWDSQQKLMLARQRGRRELTIFQSNKPKKDTPDPPVSTSEMTSSDLSCLMHDTWKHIWMLVWYVLTKTYLHTVKTCRNVHGIISSSFWVGNVCACPLCARIHALPFYLFFYLFSREKLGFTKKMM